MPSKTIPAEPTIMPATDIAYGRAKLPDPMLALAKLKNVAITLARGENDIVHIFVGVSYPDPDAALSL